MVVPDTCMNDPLARYWLWIDGVGGFLVCLGHRVTLGQANRETLPDIPLLADVSRHHATIHRDAEGYFVEAIRPIQVNGQPAEKVFLHAGDRLTLGSSCQFVFHQPVPVSSSARLDLVSGHRLVRPVDGVLLMADTLVLGPGSQSHVLVEDLEQPLILYRLRDRLGVRYGGQLLIDSQSQKERGYCVAGSRVQADSVALALEKVE